MSEHTLSGPENQPDVDAVLTGGPADRDNRAGGPVPAAGGSAGGPTGPTPGSNGRPRRRRPKPGDRVVSTMPPNCDGPGTLVRIDKKYGPVVRLDSKPESDLQFKWEDLRGPDGSELGSDADASGEGGVPGEKGEGKSPAEILMEGVEGREVILDRTDNAYILLARDDCTEPLPVKSTAFRRYLVHAFEVATGKTPPTDAVKRVIDTLDARVAADGTRRCDVHVRVAGDGERVEVDLGEDSRRAVVITPAGWTIGRSSALFRRPKGVAPLPVPARGGSIADLRPYVNLGDDEYILFLAWLTAALRPIGPYPVAPLIGEEGTAKSTLAKIARSLVDPSAAPLRSAPRDVRDLMVSACNGWMLNYENISSLPPWLSDAICQLATGSGFATRSLYENDEEAIFSARRPVMLNGIAEFVTRADLMDRSTFFRTQPIDSSRRKTEKELWDSFAEDRPRILGALCDAVSGGMRLLPSVPPDDLPRMADFAQWGEAVARGLGFEPDRFLAVYDENVDNAKKVLVDDSPIARAYMEYMSAQYPSPTPANKWQGTTFELLTALTKQVGPDAAAADAWPKTPNRLKSMLRRLAGALRKQGYFLDLDARSNSERHIEAWFSDMFELDLTGLNDTAPRAQESR
jgi:hypothetical protein